MNDFIKNIEKQLEEKFIYQASGLTDEQKRKIKRADFRGQMMAKGIMVDITDISNGNATFSRGASPVSNKASGLGEETVEPEETVELSEEKKITHDIQKGQHINRIISIISDEASHIIYLKGPTQCGKSTDVREVARMLGRKLYTFSCNGDIEKDDIFGKRDLKDDGNGNQTTYWKKGIIEQACLEGLDEDGNETGEPAILFIDEAPSMPSEIAIGLNRFLESHNPKRELVITGDSRTVVSHSGLRIIMAGNTGLRGAQSENEGMHTAQMCALDLSFVKRIFCCLRYGYNKNVEYRILKQKIGSNKKSGGIIKQILDFRDAIRGKIREGVLMTPFTTNDIVNIADGYRIFGEVAEAIYFAMFGFLGEDESAIYNEIMVSKFGKDMKSEYNDDNIDYMD